MDQYMKTPTFEVICQLGKHGVVRVQSRLRMSSLFWVQHHWGSDTSSLQASPGVGFQPGVQTLKRLAAGTNYCGCEATAHFKDQGSIPGPKILIVLNFLEVRGGRAKVLPGRRSAQHWARAAEVEERSLLSSGGATPGKPPVLSLNCIYSVCTCKVLMY